VSEPEYYELAPFIQSLAPKRQQPLGLLTLSVFVSLLLSFIAVVGQIDLIPFIDKDKLSLLPGISISCGGMIAILAFFRDRNHQKKDQIRKSDEIYLSLARDSFNEVFSLLEDRNNDRIIWVRTSRLLMQALDIKSKITTQDIIDAFELAEERLRTELYRTLSVSTGKHKNRQPLPPQFFYGIEDWETEKNLDEAAIKSGSKMVVSSVNIHKNVPEPSSGSLAVQSVIAIFKFLKFPDDYKDPLPNVTDWEGNWEDSYGIEQGARSKEQGARRFVAHTKQKYVINGKLHKKG